MNSFRLVLCLTGLLAYVIGRHFASSNEEPVILTGPGQNLAGVGLGGEEIDPGSLISKPGPAPAILKVAPEQKVAPVVEKELSAGARSIDAPVSQRPSHLTLNATATLR